MAYNFGAKHDYYFSLPSISWMTPDREDIKMTIMLKYIAQCSREDPLRWLRLIFVTGSDLRATFIHRCLNVKCLTSLALWSSISGEKSLKGKNRLFYCRPIQQWETGERWHRTLTHCYHDLHNYLFNNFYIIPLFLR